MVGWSELSQWGWEGTRCVPQGEPSPQLCTAGQAPTVARRCSGRRVRRCGARDGRARQGAAQVRARLRPGPCAVVCAGRPRVCGSACLRTDVQFLFRQCVYARVPFMDGCTHLSETPALPSCGRQQGGAAGGSTHQAAAADGGSKGSKATLLLVALRWMGGQLVQGSAFVRKKGAWDSIIACGVSGVPGRAHRLEKHGPRVRGARCRPRPRLDKGTAKHP